jgi:hypothetical protein
VQEAAVETLHRHARTKATLGLGAALHPRRCAEFRARASLLERGACTLGNEASKLGQGNLHPTQRRKIN